MRRAAVTTILAISLCVSSSANAVPWAPEARTNQWVLAQWLVPTGTAGLYRWYLADVVGYQRVGDADLLGAVFATGKCIVRERGWGADVSCAGWAIGRLITSEDFSMDPLLTSARVSVRARGQRHSVRWTASTDPPGAYSIQELCRRRAENGTGEEVGLVREAAAAGRVWGQRVAGTGRYDFAFMQSGVAASQCDPPFAPDLDRDRLFRGKTLRVSTSFEILDERR